ncbi:MAG: HU family DNA-binding protein [Cyanobacteria bacterium P01_F01_bin.153]
MNKAELIKSITDRIDVSRKDADAVVTAAVDVIMDAVAAGEKVTLVGFGTFERRDRKAREGRNPKTGEKLQIAATQVPAFSAGKQFKEAISPD